MDRLRLKAQAKINLGLDVVRRLENGYHEVRMIMQTVGICDVLTLEKTAEGIVVTTDNGELPTDENNLIYTAARMMKEKYQIDDPNAEYTTLMWVVSSGNDFSSNAKLMATENNVRLINGEEFAQLLLENGMENMPL